jgi:plastocyanin
VVWLERADGATPRPHPATDRTMVQRNKMFVPRVLVVPQGTRVSFRNDDPLFHDVFSLSKPTAFDLGLYKGGDARERVFETPGPVQLLCNIHATMQGFIFVVKSPWYAQADATGSYRIRAVPPGDYVAHVWHEAAAKVSEQRLHVEGASTNLALVVGGDASRPAFVPDKYGKPRQIQLGY